MSVGQKYGIRNAGYYALRSLRIEKFFAFWGQDLNTLTTPLECGRESRVKLDKVLYLRVFPLSSASWAGSLRGHRRSRYGRKGCRCQGLSGDDPGALSTEDAPTA